MMLQLEDAFNDLNLSGSRLQPTERCPIVNNESSTNNIRSSINSASTQGHLQQVGKLIKLLNSGLRMDKPPIITQNTIGTNEHIIGNGVPKDLNAQRIRNDLFRLLIKIWMDQGHIIITSDTVSQCRKLLLDTHDFYRLGQTVPDVSQLVVGGVVGHQQAFFVPLDCYLLVPAVVRPTIRVPPMVAWITGMKDPS